LEHLSIKAVFGRKTCPLEIGSKYCDPKKALPCPKRRLLTYFCINLRSSLQAVALLYNRKQKAKTHHIKKHDRITYLGIRNTWTYRYKIWHDGCHQGL